MHRVWQVERDLLADLGHPVLSERPVWPVRQDQAEPWDPQVLLVVLGLLGLLEQRGLREQRELSATLEQLEHQDRPEPWDSLEMQALQVGFECFGDLLLWVLK